MDDTVSRKWLMKCVNEGWIKFDTEKDTNKYIHLVRDIAPSAQSEIIRCKDCKHSEHWYRDKRRCFLWHETGIDVFEDGYCNYAERKDNG